VDAGVCGAIDLAFVVDTTGSMGPAIDSLKAEAADIISTVEAASGGDYQMALVTFGDNVIVNNDLVAGNALSVQANFLALTATGGAGEPEASDEALNTVVNGLDADDRPAGRQTRSFDGTFRSNAVKIIVMITDAHPGGFDDLFSAGVDDTNAHNRAIQAAAQEVQISSVFVPTFGDLGQGAIMIDYAATTNSAYVETGADGAGTASAIEQIVSSCGRPGCLQSPVSPANVVRILFPGQSAFVQKCVETPEIPPKVDICLVQDESGSMGDDIATLQALAGDLVTALDATGPRHKTPIDLTGPDAPVFLRRPAD